MLNQLIFILAMTVGIISFTVFLDVFGHQVVSIFSHRTKHHGAHRHTRR